MNTYNCPHVAVQRSRTPVMLTVHSHLIEGGYFSAVIVVTIGIRAEAITDPEERGIFQVYSVQYDASYGKDGANNVHKHGEAHLRAEN